MSGQLVLLALYVAVVLFIVGVVFGIRWLRRRRRHRCSQRGDG